MTSPWIHGRAAAFMLVMWTFVLALFVASGTAYAKTGNTPYAVALDATVGPDPTITLTRGGQPVTSLPAGTYTINVDDRSENHNFHLTGPGVDESTTVPEVTTTTWTLNLREGTYRFVCDPHAQNMKGSFTVTAAAQAPEGDLPFTGLDTVGIAWLGASLLTGGLALAFAAGRREPKRERA